MSKIFSRIDFFALPVQITFNNEKKYSSSLGKVISAIIYVITLALIINLSNKLLIRVNPRTSSTISYLTEAPLFNVTSLNAVYASYILTKDFVPFRDPSYFSIGVSQFIVQRNSDGSQTIDSKELKKVNCSTYYNYFKNKGFEQDFNKNSLLEAVCFDFNSRDIIIGGRFVGDYFSNIHYEIRKCTNSSNSDVICKPQVEIDSKLQGSYFQFYYLDNNIDLNNNDQIFNEYFIQYFILLDPIASKFVDIFFKQVNVSTDSGFIFEDINIKHAITFDYYREQIDTSMTNNKIIDFYVNSSNNFLFYTRIYMKFQDLAASIGGLFQVMTIVGSVITMGFNEYEMSEKMFKALFNFKYEEETSKNLKTSASAKNLNKRERKFVSRIDLNDILSNTKTPSTTNNNHRLIKDSSNLKYMIKTKLEKHRQKYLNNFDLGPFSLIKMFLCKCDKKQKYKVRLVNLAFEKLTKYLDYLEIIRTLQEFRRIKKIIFTPVQDKLFSIYEKPLISGKLERKMSTIMNENERSLALFRSYTEAKDLRHSDPYNDRLLKQMDNDFKNIFEEIIDQTN